MPLNNTTYGALTKNLPSNCTHVHDQGSRKLTNFVVLLQLLHPVTLVHFSMSLVILRTFNIKVQ